MTEKRDIEFSEMKTDVEKEFQQYATSLMQSTINGYTAVTNVRGEQNLTHINQDYVLLPIWLVTYKQKKLMAKCTIMHEWANRKSRRSASH